VREEGNVEIRKWRNCAVLGVSLARDQHHRFSTCVICSALLVGAGSSLNPNEF
jgi:hypothetical protein